MSQSQRLRLRDLRDIHELIGQCLELWDDPPAWRDHLVHGFTAMLGGRVGHYVLTDADPLAAPHARLLAVAGLASDREKGLLLEGLQVPLIEMVPNVGRAMAPVMRGRPASASMHETVHPDVWHRCQGYQRYHQPLDADGMVVSMRPVPGGVEFLACSRSLNDRPFTTRDRRRLALLHRELAPLVGTRLATDDQLGRHLLSPRLRETLDGLLAGLSEKQIAQRDHRSPATIHRHVTELYRRFNVSSRGELFSYFLYRRPRRADARPTGQPRPA